MLYGRKIMREVINKNDMELPFTEYKASIYDEIASYLSDNNCSEGVILVNRAKEKIDNYVITIKNDLDEIETICIKLSELIEKLYIEKKDIPETITINDKNIFISQEEGRYSFIYSIGFDEYKMQYRYGIINGNINKGKFYDVKSKIGFSSDSNLERYIDFKGYFESILNDFNNCSNIGALDYLYKNVISELEKLFYTDNLKIYLIKNSDEIYKLTGIDGRQIFQELYESYDTNKIKIKLISNGYSIEDNRLVELIRTRRSHMKLLNEIEKLDDINDKDIKNIYIESMEEENEKVEVLMKELNINLEELEIAIDKVNSQDCDN